MERGRTVDQPILRNGGLLALIIVLSAVPPLSIDLYIPSLPSLTEELGTTQAMSGATVTAFFLFMAIGMLTLGAVSDKYGRKRVLVTCAVMSTIASVACGLAGSVEAILVLRAIQGVAGGGMVAIATALIKDCYSGERMGKTMGITQAIAMVAPMVAPVVGAAVFQVAGWRGEFFVLALMMGLALVGSLLMKETLALDERSAEGLATTVGRVAGYLRKGRYVVFVLIIGLLNAGYMGYINLASFIYVDYFGQSEMMFSVFFALASLAAILGTLLFVRLTSTDPKRGIWSVLAVSVASAIAVLVVGHVGPVVFLLCTAPWLFASSFLRPLCVNVLMRDEEHAGAASSFINFTVTVMGSIGMIIATAGWPDDVTALGILMACVAALAVAIWVVMAKRVLE